MEKWSPDYWWRIPWRGRRSWDGVSGEDGVLEMTICSEKKHTLRNPLLSLKVLVHKLAKETVIVKCSMCNHSIPVPRCTKEQKKELMDQMIRMMECTELLGDPALEKK